MLIRRISEKDNAQVAYIIRSCLTEFGAAGNPHTAWGDPFLDRFSEVYVRENNAYWVAENDSGTVVAGVGIGPMEGSDGICELQKMYCLKEYRGCGISQNLLDIALEFAKLHYKSCYLETLGNMTRAQRFYEKNGFVKTDATIGNTGHDACDFHYIKELR